MKKTYKDYDDWQEAVRMQHRDVASRIKFKGRVEKGLDTISAEIPGEDRSYGVWDQGKEEGVVLTARNQGNKMKLNAKARLLASTEDPLSTGVAFDTLIDGKPEDTKPLVQELTDDDGDINEPDEQRLLIDDLPV